MQGQKALQPFQRLILVKELRGDKFVQAAAHFVEQALFHAGSSGDGAGQSSLELAYQESDSRTPILFILSSGGRRLAGADTQIDPACSAIVTTATHTSRRRRMGQDKL
jgi:hypothetical protein